METVCVAKVVALSEAPRRVLLLTRAETDSHAGGELDFPGGAVNEGELREVGAARETREETGLHVEPEALEEVVGDWDEGAEPRSDLPGLRLERTYYRARFATPEAVTTNPEEHSGATWYEVATALQLLAAGSKRMQRMHRVLQAACQGEVDVAA